MPVGSGVTFSTNTTANQLVEGASPPASRCLPITSNESRRKPAHSYFAARFLAAFFAVARFFGFALG